MVGAPERENFPTFQSVWDTGTGKDGSQRKLQVTLSYGENDSTNNKHDKNNSAHDMNDANKSDSDDESKKSRYSLFSPGLSARALWSVSASSIDQEDQGAWQCEECGHDNYNTDDGECESCGTGICFMDERNDSLTTLERRQLFVEEYGVDNDEESPTKTPSPKTTASLRELLSRHPSFQNKKKSLDDSMLLSWGSHTTTPTANLSPMSAFSPATTSPIDRETTSPKVRIVEEFNNDTELGDQEENGKVSFDKKLMKQEDQDLEEARDKIRREMPSLCNSPTIIFCLVAIGVTFVLWMLLLLHTKRPVELDNGGKSSSGLMDGLWVVKGDEVFGDEPDYQSGASVSLADGGKVMAVGVGNFGPVRSYSLDNETGKWLQQGQDISLGDGPKHVSLSRRHGRTMAVASESDGSVAVFAYDQGTGMWNLLGEPLLFGVTNRDDARASVALSDTGKVLAIGVPAEGSLRSDSVRVVGYDKEQDGWIPVGSDIVLDAETRIQHGGSVSLSTNGMVLAVGSWVGESSSYSSHVEVYSYSNNTWQQVGGETNIGSRLTSIYSEVSVSLSGDGNIVAMGSGWSCRIFRFVEEEDKWSQLGQDLVGRTVSLSTDGKVVAIGNPAGDDHGIDSGEAVVYAFDEGTSSWEQVGESIPGDAKGDLFGSALSLSEDGRQVAIGSPGSGAFAQHSGSATVFELVLDE